MNKHSVALRRLRCAPIALLATLLATSPAAFPDVVELATGPLTTATTTSVLPNLMFILDNSGSMAWDFTPDYMSEQTSSPTDDDKQCRDSGDDDYYGTVYQGAYVGSTRVLDLCVVGDPPYMNSDMNTQYYNPEIRYRPGVDYQGASLGNQSEPTKVATDPYGKQQKNQLLDNEDTVDLTTEYPDRVWCKKKNPSSRDLSDEDVCRRNTRGYLYPDATFKYGRYEDQGSPDQRVTSWMLDGVIKKFGAPYYYTVQVSEYCDSPNLNNCITARQPTGTYTFPAKSRWCTDDTFSNCQAVRTSKFNYPRYLGSPGIPGERASGTFEVINSKNRRVRSIKVNGVDILGREVSWGSSNNDSSFASRIANQINDYVSQPDYTATRSGATIRITAAQEGLAGNGSITVSGDLQYRTSSGGLTGGRDAVGVIPGYTFVRTDIVPEVDSYPKSGARTDCAGETCTYAEEITNFANWYAYYRTRMQAMKTAASLAFREIGDNFRVGFITIANQTSSGHYLPIDKFSSGVKGTNSQKERWYRALFGISPTSGTPLRSALSIVGRIYGGQKPVGNSDPVQYSCQQNFALLTTDGYWNTDSNRDVKGLDGYSVGNLDSDPSTRPMYEGPVPVSNSLADVAKYYYETDLRDENWRNCTGALGANVDVCQNNVFVTSTDTNRKQHMTTFTLGLGVDGTLSYQSDYMVATSGDFYRLKTGSGSPVLNWPEPKAETETAVDDLWHAAVNGGGVYFSAKDPAQLAKGLESALASIGAKVGAGSAAATSTLNPVAGDNFAYVASYTTQKWQGNLEARTINLSTGIVSEAAAWCVEDVVAGTCLGDVVADNSDGSTAYYCVTPGAAEATCAGDLEGTSCKVQMPKACTGTLKSKIGTSKDTRTIYMRGSGGKLVAFDYANLNEIQKAYFSGTGLSQRAVLDEVQKVAAGGANLVNYLRGQTGFEDRSTNPAANRVFRYREATLGDAVESQPAYVGKPTFSYADPGYSDFAAANASRGRTVYIGANDGMLHAFDATTGQERWAFIPSMVMPNLWKLADMNYASNHVNFVNGSPTIGDVYDSASKTWRTILVGGLNGGGRGYYALDITNPAAPTLLWEIDSSTEANLGYSFSNPIITKKGDGTWVVLFTSGYNNVSPGNGKGYLFVRNAITGEHIARISTGVGESNSPSGLGKIAAWADRPEKNNLATHVYGGDLEGNVWRFDINAATVTKFAVLRDPGGNTQPITARPELGLIGGKRVIFIGTGKYLETADLEDTQTQTLYAIKDDDAEGVLDNPRTILVKQTLTETEEGRKVSAAPVDFKNKRGWYIDWPTEGERVNIDSLLDAGTLFVPTIVPTATVCEPGGIGWLHYFDYLSGTTVKGAEDGLVGQSFSAPIVGVNILRLPNGKRPVLVVRSDEPTPEQPPKNVGEGGENTGFVGKRVIWRELVP